MITAEQNPFAIFANWLNEAKSRPEITEPTAMSVATVDSNNRPNLRILLLKHFDEKGFCFFGNLNSVKFQDIKQNPFVALDFHWMPLGRQVRIKGKVEPLTKEESDAYFASRSRGSKISAWASKQSQPLNDYSEFDLAIKQIEEKFKDQEIPRPDFWAGYRLVPESIEFWLEKEFRRHERYRFTRDGNDWNLSLLYP